MTSVGRTTEQLIRKLEIEATWRPWSDIDHPLKDDVEGSWLEGMRQGLYLGVPAHWGDTRPGCGLFLSGAGVDRLGESLLVEVLTDPGIGVPNPVSRDKRRVQFHEMSPDKGGFAVRASQWVMWGKEWDDELKRGAFLRLFPSQENDRDVKCPKILLLRRLDGVTWTDWAVESVVDLLEDRAEHGLITLLTTQQSSPLPQRLYDVVDEHFISAVA